MATHSSRSGSSSEAPGLARTGPRAAVARFLPAAVSLPLRAYVGRSREPELRLLRSLLRRGETAVDIGAHTGVYTHWMRRQVGPRGLVLAFEPQPELRRYLAAGLSTPYYRNILLSDIALSDHAGEARLTIPRIGGARQVAWASLGGGWTDGDEVTVRTATLDEQIGQRPVALVKCDVEGHEAKVLAGASGVLVRQRPVWLVEVEHRHAGASVDEVLTTFARAGYRASYLDGSGRLSPVPTENLRPERLNLVEPGRYVNNFVFLPG